MEDQEEILIRILSKEEIFQIPEDIRKKVEISMSKNIQELYVFKALSETAQNTLGDVREKSEQQITELTSKIEDLQVKFDQSNQLIGELREQLSKAHDEATKLLQTTQRYEIESNECRKERNDVVDERDSLLKMLDRRNTEIDMLRSEIKTFESQLQIAFAAKCEAISKYDEVQSKERLLANKEKRMEQEHALLTSQVASLNEELNRHIREIQNLRRDNTSRVVELETKLNGKIEELRIANDQIVNLNETVNSLSAKANDLASKILTQGEDSSKMMDYYKKELHAKTKLADLYKTNIDDHVTQINELTSTVAELKKLLNDATEQYGELETKLKTIQLEHEQEIEEKNVEIQSLKDELKNANDLLQQSREENVENAIEKLAPTAAVTHRLIKSDMSLTELYSKYVKATEEAEMQRKENDRLNLQMKTILQELQEKAPLIHKLQLDYQKIVEENSQMSEQLENSIQEKIDLNSKWRTASERVDFLEREHKKMKIQQKDLARQLCFLLEEIERTRGGFVPDNDQSVSSDTSANEVISKKLVTFSNIAELLENNQKLIIIVRELSMQLEDMEKVQNNIEQASYEAKLQKLSEHVDEIEKSRDQQTAMLNMCMQQRDKYKKLYYEQLRISGNDITNPLKSDENQTSDAMDGLDDEMSSTNKCTVSDEKIATKNKRIAELEEKIKELQDQIKFAKEEHENYRKERATNDEMLNKQFDSMRTEIRELTSQNCQLISTVKYNNEQISVQQKNVTVYKKQIQALEERNKNYEKTIVKHEQTVTHLRNELMHVQEKLSMAECQLENLKSECRVLRDAEARLQMERDALHRERQTNNLMMTNLEMIKASFERSETEGRQRMEIRLDEMQRECSALRRRLQEEQDRFRELGDDLKRQTNTAKERMEQEKEAADKLRKEIIELREELMTKTNQVDDLSKKLQESLTPNVDDNPITKANKKAQEFQLKYEESLIEINSLRKELEMARTHADQYSKISESTEKELKDLHEIYVNYRNKAEEELQRLRTSEINLKTRIDELETEIQLQITGSQLNSGQTVNQIDKIKAELKQTLEKLQESNRENRTLRDKVNQLQSSLQIAENKYANEMSLHSGDILELTKTKEEITKIREQIDEYKLGRDRAIHMLEETKKGWLETEKKLNLEKDELEKRLIDLDAQNASLHDQIEALTARLSVTSKHGGDVYVQQQNTSTNVDDTMNDSSSVVADVSFTNRSLTEDEMKNSGQLLEIIKYLRKEKDIAFTKVDILKSENSRLISEQNILQKKINEYKDTLNNERNKSESVVLTAIKHDEILRKIETLNAVTDSNRVLREERDNLSERIAELSERISKTEDELFPLQEKNRELQAKVEEMSAENTSLRTEAIRWRQRANILIEKSNRNPEDFKRIQNERESLAKLLTAEKDALKQAQEELQTVKNEKTKFENDITNLRRQIQGLLEEKRKIQEENNSLKQQNTRMTHEIMELKNQLLQKEDELKKINDDLVSKDAQIADSDNKVVQLRKIAKRYKDSFFELKNKELGGENPTAANDGDTQDEAGPSTKQLQDSEKELKEKINDLNTQIQAIQQENEILRNENNILRKTLTENESTLRQIKQNYINCKDSSDVTKKELAEAKAQLHGTEQSRDEYVNIKNQLEARITHLEKELANQEKASKESLNRLTNENEALASRIEHLKCQLGVSPKAIYKTKPSTSSGSQSDKGPTEAPRTANVKPMSGPSGQQSATVTPWRGSETPLASIRPMSVQNSRTAAVLPTTQTSNIAAIQGSSSSSTSGSNTALVPPQQQVHTTGNSSGEAMSSSPTSSHTDYMPATSTAAVGVVPPMGASAESSQEAESIPTQNNESSSTSQIIVSGGQQQQAVALVSPRVEGTQSIVPPVVIQQSQETNQPSTSGTSCSSQASVSSHHQASSSNTVTTTQAGHKRQRDFEGDSSTSNEEAADKSQPQNKRTRIQAGETSCQGVSESRIEVEYQVPTSSQRDQEDDVISVESSEEGMPDEGNADADDGAMEDEADNGEPYEEEVFEQEQDVDDNEGPDIDEDNAQSDNNEADVVDDSGETPNQSRAAQSSNNQVAPDAGTCQIVEQSSSGTQPSEMTQSQGSQQIQTISSGSDASSVTTQSTSSWRQTTPLSRNQQATLLMLQQQQGFEEVGDSIVPSTPTLYVPRRSDGFSEAVSSPHPQVPHGRFVFSETSSTGGQGIASESVDESRIESESADDRSISQQISPQRGESAATLGAAVAVEGTSSSTTEKSEQSTSQGPSNSADDSIPEITVTTANDEDAEMSGEGASTSEAHDSSQGHNEESETEEGLDGVTSEGEKMNTGADESVEMEEGREAEASTSPSINTRSRASQRGGTQSSRRSHSRGGSRSSGRPTPVVWHDPPRSQQEGNRNVSPSMRNEPGSPSRPTYNINRGQRPRRMRRAQNSNFGGNMRY